MKFVTSLLIKLLVASITPQTARQINDLIIDLLNHLADKTATNVDDRLVRTLERFLKHTNRHRKQNP